MEHLNVNTVAAGLCPVPENVDEKWHKALNENMQGVRIVVLDDDPTGVQTVHDVPVFTDWSEEAIEDGLKNEPLFFILTNSRAFSKEQTRAVHTEIAQRIAKIAGKLSVGTLIVSRSDSTLRGHFPLETDTLREQMEAGGAKIDGQIICPFFAEGGRFTLDGVHYVKMGDELVPAGETEFAKDATFGYTKSDLAEWVEEKTGGRIKACTVQKMTLKDIRSGDLDKLCDQLCSLNGGTIAIDGWCEADMRLAAAAIAMAAGKGKQFIFRTAAGLVKALGGIESRPLLSAQELKVKGGKGGLIVVGSHVQKTTRQLEELLKLPNVQAREFKVNGDLAAESDAAREWAEGLLREDKIAVVYTSRDRVQVPGGPEEQLRFSVAVSEAVTDIVRKCQVVPGFLIAKGGITSSDVGIKGLAVKKAMVAGQAAPGIPVWRCGPEARFPGLCYVIFPGNVGDEDTLRTMVARLTNQD